MSQDLLVMVPRPVGVPRGAAWAASTASKLLAWASVVRHSAAVARGPSMPPAPGTYRRTTPSVFAVARRRVWDALARHGRQRAQRELLDVARRWASIDPEVSARLRAAATFDTDTEVR